MKPIIDSFEVLEVFFSPHSPLTASEGFQFFTWLQVIILTGIFLIHHPHICENENTNQLLLIAQHHNLVVLINVDFGQNYPCRGCRSLVVSLVNPFWLLTSPDQLHDPLITEQFTGQCLATLRRELFALPMTNSDGLQKMMDRMSKYPLQVSSMALPFISLPRTAFFNFLIGLKIWIFGKNGQTNDLMHSRWNI